MNFSPHRATPRNDQQFYPPLGIRYRNLRFLASAPYIGNSPSMPVQIHRGCEEHEFRILVGRLSLLDLLKM